MGSFRRILTASLVEKRRPCCRAGLPCCTVRGQGMTAAFSQGQLQDCEARCAAMGTQGCSSEQGPFAPGGCVLGQGLCCLPGSALSLPRRSAQHCREKLWVEGATPGRAGQGPHAVERVLHGSGLLTAPHHPQDFSRRTSMQGLPQKKGVCPLSFLLLAG